MLAPNIPPLTWPISGKPAAGPTKPPMVVYVLIALVGGAITLAFAHPAALFASGIVCGILFTCAQRNLRKPVVLHIREQLLARPDCLDRWGPDPTRLQVASVLCAALARAKKWPNAHFIPEDPLELAFFEISGVDAHLEVIEVGNELRKITGRTIDWQKLGEVAKSCPATLADLLDAA